MAQLSVSFEWLSGCSGCELSVVDLHERLLRVLETIRIVRLPILMDVKHYPEAELGVVTGALRTEHDLESARRMRDSCRHLLAFGTCAVYGGPQGAGYAHRQAELAESAFVSNPTTATHFVPDQGVPELLSEGVLALDQSIPVDFYLPGCPPHPYFVFEALRAVVEGGAPEFGGHNVCYRCRRKMERSECRELRRPHQQLLDPDRCLLTQGVLCMGSATLDRCLAPCPNHGVPCTGCAGPSEHIVLEPNRDVRTEVATRMAMLTGIAQETIQRQIEQDAKTWYAYAMASPVFRQKPTFLLRRWISQPKAIP